MCDPFQLCEHLQFSPRLHPGLLWFLFGVWWARGCWRVVKLQAGCPGGVILEATAYNRPLVIFSC